MKQIRNERSTRNRGSAETLAQVRELHRSQPFKPFTIHMADGRRVTVNHPEFMAFAPSGRTVIVYQLDESFDIIDLLLVTDLEVRRRPRAGRARSK